MNSSVPRKLSWTVAAGGQIARLLAANGCSVIGVELDGEKANMARQWCQAVIIGDLEHEETLAQVRNLCDRFDCILCSHVLEHLREPSRVLKGLKTLCDPEKGFFVVALPNVAYWRVRLHLLAGRWEYQDEGILDRTHLRFFTLHSAMNLLGECRLEVVHIAIPEFQVGGIRRFTHTALRSLTSPNFYSPSFVLKCVPRT